MLSGPACETVELADLATTRAVGLRLGQALRAGDFVGISGPLGAGKTTLVKAIAEGAGVNPGEVTSPTFTLVHLYRGSRLELHHADLYRIGSMAELHAIGFSELVDAEGAVLVEWIDRFPAAAASDWLELRLSLSGPLAAPEARHLEAVVHGPRAAALLGALGVLPAST